MRILKNKYFILGNLLLILIAIPLTLFFIRRQQELRGGAVPSSTLSFSPPQISTTLGENFNVDININPGQNLTSIVDITVLFDPTKLELIQMIPNTAVFPVTLRGPIISGGSASISLNIGADVTRAVQTTTKAATIIFKPLAATVEGPIKISFDPAQTRVLSLGAGDQPGENVLANTSPATVTINPRVGGVSPTPTPTPTPTSTLTPTPTPSNPPPSCTSLSVSPQASGITPFSVTLKAQGNDPDGKITKVTFNFGDGGIQDVNNATTSASFSAQLSHTYQNPGSFSTTAVFTDDKNAVSQPCTQVVEVARPTPTPTPTPIPTKAAIPQKPPVPPVVGDLSTTLGILGGIILTIIGGAVLLGL